MANEPVVLRAPLAPAHQAQVYVYQAGIVDSVYVQVGDSVAVGDTLAVLDDTARRQAETQAYRIYRAAQRRLKRTQVIYAQGGLSTQLLEKITFAHDQAHSAWQEAVRKRRLSVLTAPLTGLVAYRVCQPGTPVSAHQRLFQLIQAEDLLAVVFIPAHQLAGLRVGMLVQAQVEGTSIALSGTLRQLSPVVDPASGTCRAEVFFPQAGHHLRPGQVIELSF